LEIVLALMQKHAHWFRRVVSALVTTEHILSKAENCTELMGTFQNRTTVMDAANEDLRVRLHLSVA
jgi:hypothetical protein